MWQNQKYGMMNEMIDRFVTQLTIVFMKDIMDLLANKAWHVRLIFADKWSRIMSLHATDNVYKLRILCSLDRVRYSARKPFLLNKRHKG